MNNYFSKIKGFINELEYTIVTEDTNDQVFVITKEDDGIKNMVIACADPILIVEQQLLKIKNPNIEIYKSLLKKNRDIIHGALVLDETGTTVIYRDTLELENLDKNELEASIESLSLLLSEYSQEIIKFSL
jgi:hypothetical protein